MQERVNALCSLGCPQDSQRSNSSLHASDRSLAAWPAGRACGRTNRALVAVRALVGGGDERHASHQRHSCLAHLMAHNNSLTWQSFEHRSGI